jgi:hypothetical protein
MTDLTCHSTLWDTEKSSQLWNTPELIIADGGSACFLSQWVGTSLIVVDDADVGPPSQSYAAFSILQR